MCVTGPVHKKCWLSPASSGLRSRWAECPFSSDLLFFLSLPTEVGALSSCPRLTQGFVSSGSLHSFSCSSLPLPEKGLDLFSWAQRADIISREPVVSGAFPCPFSGGPRLCLRGKCVGGLLLENQHILSGGAGGPSKPTLLYVHC